MELAGGSTISLWTVVAAVQALERSVAAHASRLFSLEHRAGNSEKKHLDCEKMVGEFGNQLESKCAALDTLIQEYGRLQKRLQNMENLLKNRNLWILRLPPGVEAPKAPAVALENDATGFSTQEWENLEEWQRELYGKVLTGKREALILLDDVISEPALLSRLQGGEAPCSEEEAAPGEIPAEPDCSIPVWSFAVTVKSEEEEEPRAKEQGAMEGVEFSELGVGPDAAGHRAQAPAEGRKQPGARSCQQRDVRGNPTETGSEDSIIQIKQEEGLCTADRKEEAAEAPGEPCPAEQGFYEPEASSQTRKGSEVDARELPGTEGEHLQRDPATGFQTYARDVSSGIEQEEPPCSEQQGLQKEEISGDPSTDENLKRDHPANCLESKTCDLEVPGRPGEVFPKDPSHGVTWDSQWNSEMMETATPGNGNSLGGDAQYDFFSAQEKSLEKRPCMYKCERNCPQQDLQGEGDMFPGPTYERMFPLLHLHPGEKGMGLGEKGMSLGEKGMGLGEKGMGPGAAPTPCEGPGPRSESGETPPGTGRPREQDSLGTEEAAENEESFPTDTSGSSPCWEPPLARGSPAQQQSQGRGRSYICSDCGKDFVCHSWLVRHQTSHTGERPYKCSKCDKTYRRKDNLLNHQRRHTGEKPFQCPLCSKSFVLKRSLLKHQEGHMQEPRATGQLALREHQGLRDAFHVGHPPRPLVHPPGQQPQLCGRP
uniref:Uncharacterized protein n=1 Tax=Geospiza parvula TaxID=87175 RepID=A0A8C3N1H0_GEOPR